MPDTFNLMVTRDQAERLLALVDAENAAQKNRLVSVITSPLLSDDDRKADALRIADDSVYLVTLRANIARRLDNSLAR